MKKNGVWIILALIILFLFFTRQGRNSLTQIFEQSGPVNMDFGGGYQPGVYVLPEFQVPLVNGVSLPPPLSTLADDGSCCCAGGPSGRASPPAMPFVSPSVQPSYTPPPAYVSLASPPPELILYSGTNFDGNAYGTSSTVPALGQTSQKWWNDRAQSLEVKSGIWRVYEHANQRGRSAVLSPGRYNNMSLRLRGLNKNITGLYLERA